MAVAVKPHQDYYCYVLFRADGSPFYVGKGRRNRWLEHEKTAKRGRSYKDNIICGMIEAGREVPKVKISEGLNAVTAAACEIAWIAALGRYPNGPLTNLTAGGDGCVELSAESRAKIAASLTGRVAGPPSAETRAKISAANAGKIYRAHSDERRQAIGEAMAEQWADPSVRARRLQAGMTGRKHSPETVEKMRVRQLAIVSDEKRERMSAVGRANRGRPSPKGMLGKRHSNETKARLRSAQIARRAQEKQEKGSIRG